MTEIQQMAFDHPCYIAVETAHPRFRHSGEVKGVEVVSVVMTINAGYE